MAVDWFRSSLNQSLEIIADHFSKYRMADALLAVYKLIWDDFCSWYLEMVKPAYGKSLDQSTYTATISFLDSLLRLLHPFMPFITEEIYQRIRKETDPESITIAPYPQTEVFDREITDRFARARQAIMAIRNFRQEKNLSPKQSIELYIRKNNNEVPDTTFDSIAKKLCNIDKLEYIDRKPENAFPVIVNTTELYIPLDQGVDVEAEIASLENDLKYQKGFLRAIEKKLSNEKFVGNAPAAVVESERKKQRDAQARIRVIEEQLRTLKP